MMNVDRLTDRLDMTLKALSHKRDTITRCDSAIYEEIRN